MDTKMAGEEFCVKNSQYGAGVKTKLALFIADSKISLPAFRKGLCRIQS